MDWITISALDVAVTSSTRRPIHHHGVNRLQEAPI